MIKNFALLATVAALFVACSSENTESMEKPQTEAQQPVEQVEEPAVIITPEVTETDAVIIEGNETPVVVEEGVVIEEKN